MRWLTWALMIFGLVAHCESEKKHKWPADGASAKALSAEELNSLKEELAEELPKNEAYNYGKPLEGTTAEENGSKYYTIRFENDKFTGAQTVVEFHTDESGKISKQNVRVKRKKEGKNTMGTIEFPDKKYEIMFHVVKFYSDDTGIVNNNNNIHFGANYLSTAAVDCSFLLD